MPSLDPATATDLEQNLNINLNGIQIRYDFYVDIILDTLNKKGITAEVLRVFVLDLPAGANSSDVNNLKCLCEVKKDLQKASTVSGIFFVLKSRFSSFLDYEIFEFIREKFCLDCTDEKINYPAHLVTYLKKHRIVEFMKICPNMQWLFTSSSKHLTLKLGFEITCRLDDLHKTKSVVADILNFNPLILRIIKMEEGCVQLTLLIPGAVADAIFTNNRILTKEQEQRFKDASVLKLECNGFSFDFSDQQLPSGIYDYLLVHAATIQAECMHF